MRTELCDLCVKYGTDKVIWGYTPFYNAKLGMRREEVKRVLEIGICGYRDIPNNVVGASLFVWRDYFPNATIYGIDNDGRFIFNDQDRIRTAQCDAYDEESLEKVITGWGIDDKGFDFIVDDAVHDPIPQISLFNQLLPHMAQDGLYAIEDVCPYKLPNSDLKHMLKLLGPDPDDALKAGVISTHKNEKLILLERC